MLTERVTAMMVDQGVPPATVQAISSRMRIANGALYGVVRDDLDVQRVVRRMER